MNPLLILLIITCAVNVDSSRIRLDPSSHHFIDSQGRERFFRGINVVHKGSPYHPNPSGPLSENSFSLADIENFEAWGFNVIRLGTLWDGGEPTRNEYNTTYFDIIEEIVNNSASHGIYSLFDLHQDLFSQHYCGGGIPLWASIPDGSEWLFPRPVQWTPYNDSIYAIPERHQCHKYAWSTYYLAQATGHAFQKLYDNHDGIQDAMGLFWKKIAERFKSFDAVLGYELINEPWAGDIYSNPLRLVPGYADKHNIGPMYDRLNKYIREADDQKLIFFEPVTWDDFIPVGFEHAPGGHHFADRSALSYHYYKLPSLNLRWEISARQRDQNRLKVGAMCTEFDIFTKKYEDITQSLDIFDEYLQSWIGWDYTKSYFYYSNYTIKTPYIKVLSRTYAQAVAGKTKSMKFDTKTRDFTLVYESCSHCGETEVYLNEDLHYELGFDVKLENERYEWYQPKKNRIHVRVKNNTEALSGETIKLEVNRKDKTTIEDFTNEFLR